MMGRGTALWLVGVIAWLTLVCALLPVGAQSYLWSTLNGVPIGSGLILTGNATIGGYVAHNSRTTITVDGATTFAVTTDYVVLACTGNETINTITGGVTGMILVLEHTDTECTIADDDTATAANAVDLVGTATDDVGAAKKILVLLYNGTDWQEIAESDN